MKKYLALIFLLIFVGQAFGQATTPLPLQGDRSAVGTITTFGACNSMTTTVQAGCVLINTQGASSIVVSIGPGIISGGYILFEGNPSDTDANQWVAIYLTSGITSVNFAPSGGNFWGKIGGYKKFRARAVGGTGSTMVTINVGAGEAPGILQTPVNSQSFNQVYTTDGVAFSTGICNGFPHVTLFINATGAGELTANVGLAYDLSNIIPYRNVIVGRRDGIVDIPAILNLDIASPYFTVNLNYNYATTGTVRISGGCTR